MPQRLPPLLPLATTSMNDRETCYGLGAAVSLVANNGDTELEEKRITTFIETTRSQRTVTQPPVVSNRTWGKLRSASPAEPPLSCSFPE